MSFNIHISTICTKSHLVINRLFRCFITNDYIYGSLTPGDVNQTTYYELIHPWELIHPIWAFPTQYLLFCYLSCLTTALSDTIY